MANYISSSSGGTTSGNGGSIFVIGGSTGTGFGGSVTIGGPPSRPTKGGDVTICPGRGANGGADGDIVFSAANGTEIVRLNQDGIMLFGHAIPLDRILKLLGEVSGRPCTCSTAQILNAGCKCGGV